MFVAKRKKLLRLSLIVLAILAAYSTIFSIKPIQDFTLRYQQVVFLNLRLLYSKFSSSDLQLDENSEFQSALSEAGNIHFSNDSAAEVFFINPTYQPKTSINAPSYYFNNNDSPIPKVQPYDPRFTLSIYLNYIRMHPNEKVPFHWSDWVDLFDLYKYILLPTHKKPNCSELFDLSKRPLVVKGSEMKPVDQYCHDDPQFPLGFKVSGFPVSQTRDNIRLLGKSFLYSNFASPAKLVFLTNTRGSYIVDVENYQENSLQNSLLQTSMVSEVLQNLQSNKLDVLHSYKQLLMSRTPENENQVMTDPVIHLTEDMFNVDSEKLIMDLKNVEVSNGLSPMDQNYLQMLLYSTGTDTPHKYFAEAKLVNSDLSKVFGEHHDWRFFNGLTINTDKQTLALHRLIKNYLQFCRSHGIITWIAHGSLLSWYWNGMAFPWDADTDAQMPIRDLHRLGREFNQTMVIENVGLDNSGHLNEMEFVGMGQFFIDVGSSITHRERGNGMNNIDARFIDVSTGLYVDITGFSVSLEPAPSRYDYLLKINKTKNKQANSGASETQKNVLKQTYNCRNRHFASLSELSPLALSAVQNQLGFVPTKFGLLLDHEYQTKGMLDTSFQDYTYISSLRIWVPNRVILDYMQDKEKWIATQKGQKTKRALSSGEQRKVAEFDVSDMSNLMLNKWFFREYMLTKEFTKFHSDQMSPFLSSNIRKYAGRIDQFARDEKANKPLWGDIFMAKVEEGFDYDAEVERVGELELLLSVS